MENDKALARDKENRQWEPSELTRLTGSSFSVLFYLNLIVDTCRPSYGVESYTLCKPTIGAL